jgi:hypothetical protein
VTFTVKSSEPVPFNRCYCTVCRKTAGAGGFAINIGADFNTLEIEGREHIRVYRARIPSTETGEITVSKGERSFCELCGSALWAWDPDWPDLVHPHASAIDTDLPVPPFNWHMMLGSKASWAVPCIGRSDRKFDEFPDQSLADWHRENGFD